MSENNLIARIAAYNATKAARVSRQLNSQVQPAKLPENEKSFETVLRETTNLKFSAHALQRIEQRQVEMNPTEMVRLESAISEARAKGSKDALVLLNNKAFIVSVANSTVITALNSDENHGKVFTNIDSAVVA